MQYACKIKVETNPHVISFKKMIDLGFDIPELTIKDLISHGVTDDNCFTIYQEENQKYKLVIYCKRLETPEEVQKRVEKEIAYNIAYDIFHSKY